MPNPLSWCPLLFFLNALCVCGDLSVAPNSTVVAHGTTHILITANTTEASLCRFAVGPEAAFQPFASMEPFTVGGVGPSLTTHATNVSVNATLLNVALRCSDAPTGAPAVLRYRVLGEGAFSAPAVGNLWGSGNFYVDGVLNYTAARRIDLWLGTSFNATELAHLRALNPRMAASPSFNSIEVPDGYPEWWYLHNVTGQTKADRWVPWPGSYRIDITNPAVAVAHATALYSQFAFDGGSRNTTTLPFDGVFTDNVFFSLPSSLHDIYGRPFYPDTTGSGKPDNRTEFNAKWRAGVVEELSTLRRLLGPHAFMSGHAMQINQEPIPALFNGLSIGFDMPEVIEGLKTFSAAWGHYAGWFASASDGGPRTPHVTMMESAIPLQLGYGYGFGGAVKKNMPPATLEFARTDYRYMRFGLVFTLMHDGYFTHEIGDSAHGQNWWYDELDHALGHPLGAARFVGGAPPAPLPVAWSLWAAPHANATLSMDAASLPPVPGVNASARVDVATSDGNAFDVELQHGDVELVVGAEYVLSFYAKASAGGQVGVVVHRSHPDWRSYGLSTQVAVGPQWQQFNLTFTATVDGMGCGSTISDARLEFEAGVSARTVWVAAVALGQAPPPVLVREFQCGAAVLNAGNASVVVPVGPGFRRLAAPQAPMHQAIVDDASAAFSTAGAWEAVVLDSGYNQTRPTSEEAAGPYFHHWYKFCHVGTGGGVATFNLSLPFEDTYDVAAWWANATQSDTWSPRVQHVVEWAGSTVATATLDQRWTGDQWNPIAAGVKLGPGATLTVSCPVGDTCVADAVLVKSGSRYNNGAAVSGGVEVAPMDGIVLDRVGSACA